MDTISQMNGLTLFDSADIVPVLMTVDEAEAWDAEVGKTGNRLRFLLQEGYRREAWRALGYANWSMCLRSLAEKHGFTERRLWQLHQANEIQEAITENFSVDTMIPDSHLRPLTTLEPEAQREVWAKAVETAPNGKVTAAHVQNVVEEYRKPERPHVAHNSGNNEWYTPKEYIEAARFVLGAIDLDPASSQAANEVVRASVFYTVEDDGLSRDWRGRVWMNPPYSEDLIGKFSSKLADHFAAGDVTAAIVLVNNATETRWFRRLIEVASAVVFPSSRVRFWRPDGKTAGPLQGQALIYMGEHPQKFREGFGSFGWGATL